MFIVWFKMQLDAGGKVWEIQEVRYMFYFEAAPYVFCVEVLLPLARDSSRRGTNLCCSEYFIVFVVKKNVFCYFNAWTR